MYCNSLKCVNSLVWNFFVHCLVMGGERKTIVSMGKKSLGVKKDPTSEAGT